MKQPNLSTPTLLLWGAIAGAILFFIAACSHYKTPFFGGVFHISTLAWALGARKFGGDLHAVHHECDG